MDRKVGGRFDLQLNVDMARHGYSLSIIKKKEVKIKVRFLNLITERKVILHINLTFLLTVFTQLSSFILLYLQEIMLLA